MGMPFQKVRKQYVVSSLEYLSHFNNPWREKDKFLELWLSDYLYVEK